MEIERKFKLKNLPIEINNCEKKEIVKFRSCIRISFKKKKSN